MKRRTQEEFLEDMKNINSKNFYGEPYDFSKFIYEGSKAKSIVICPEHGEFLISPNKLLINQGCHPCGILFRVEKQTKSQEEFLKETKHIKFINSNGGPYDFSKFIYRGAFVKGIVICLYHGEFHITADNVLSGRGCPICRYLFSKTKITKSHQKFVIQANIVHDHEYEYIESYVNDITPLKIKHLKCGYVFLQAPHNHLQGNGCHQCKKSKGEKIISRFLNKLNIYYQSQKIFDQCRNKRSLPFDFYLPNHNLCIEYDGRQHYKPIEKWGGNNYLIEIQKNDQIKNEFCKENNINLLRISYQEFKSIEQILESKLKELGAL